MTRTDEILQDPNWFPLSLDTGSDAITFGQVDRKLLSDAAFLDERVHDSIRNRETIRLGEAVDRFAEVSSESPAFIFHSAFCCSTLLARALDEPGQVLSLKEPGILMAVANALRVDDGLRHAPERGRRLVRTVLGLLGRRLSADEQVLIKPTNSANNLLPYVVRSGAKAVIVYGSLRDFLISVLKKGEACKSFVRGQYNIFALDTDGLGSIPQRQAVSFTDLQACTVVWRHQMELFQRALSDAADAQLASLDFRALLRNPTAVLRRVADHLMLGLSDAALEAKVSGDTFRRNAKFADQRYSSDQRDLDAATIEERYRESLDLMEQWATELSLGTAVRMPLAAAITA